MRVDTSPRQLPLVSFPELTVCSGVVKKKKKTVYSGEQNRNRGENSGPSFPVASLSSPSVSEKENSSTAELLGRSTDRYGVFAAQRERLRLRSI